MSKEIRTTEQILQEDFNWTVDGDPGRYSLFVNLIKPAMEAYHSQFTTPSTTVEQAAKEYADKEQGNVKELLMRFFDDLTESEYFNGDRNKVVEKFLAGAALASTPGNDWVSVESGLPEYDTLVIVFIVDEFGDTATRVGELLKTGEWYAPFRKVEGVTHWQPLPSPPSNQ